MRREREQQEQQRQWFAYLTRQRNLREQTERRQTQNKLSQISIPRLKSEASLIEGAAEDEFLGEGLGYTGRNSQITMVRKWK